MRGLELRELQKQMQKCHAFTLLCTYYLNRINFMLKTWHTQVFGYHLLYFELS
jgi:hypothetical protein